MGAPEINVQQTLLPTYGNQGYITISQEEAARRYHQWASTRKPKSNYDKAFDSVRALMPDWFLFSALIAGVFVLGMVMLKVNPLLKPIKTAVVWFLDFCEGFLKRDKPDEGK